MEASEQNDRRRGEAYFSGSRRYREHKTGMIVVNVHAGDCFITNSDEEVAATILGSCVAACIRDPIARVGGMNHFLLPGTTDAQSESARFGAFAMEQLINEILKRGGIKNRLEVKIFGGGNVIESSAMIGDKNAAFARDYLKREGLLIMGEDLGGTCTYLRQDIPVTITVGKK